MSAAALANLSRPCFLCNEEGICRHRERDLLPPEFWRSSFTAPRTRSKAVTPPRPIQKQAPLPVDFSVPDKSLWAAVLIARVHSAAEIEDNGMWTCDCRCCEAVRAKFPQRKEAAA